MEILKERILEVMKRYENRKPDVIYAHMFDSTIWKVISRRNSNVSNEMYTGEIVHQGAGNVLDPVEEKCRNVSINTDNIVTPALERFVKYDSNGKPYVEVCGQADGMYEGYPVELKTTRSSKRPTAPRTEWVRRAKIYGWLYGTEEAYLVVFNVITGREIDHKVKSYSDEEMKEIVEKWLRGEFPNPTLQYLKGRGVTEKNKKLENVRVKRLDAY